MVLYDDTYLVFKHFPNELSNSDKVDFLKHFGATDVKCLSSEHKKGNLCFARFASKEVAKEIICKLHQVEIMGQVLSVEFVRGSDLNLNLQSYIEFGKSEGNEDKGDQNKYYEQFLTRLNSWTNLVDFHRPPPVHLRYYYPAPALSTLTNIARALNSIPKFYTQVLHLMNKMNLPCPFDENFPIDCDIYVTDSLKPLTQLSEGESEIEEDSTIEKEILPQNLFNRKRKKTIKRLKLIKPTINTDSVPKIAIPTSEIFEAPQKDINPKRIEVKVSADLSSIKESKHEIVEVAEFAPLDLPEDLNDEKSEELDDTYKGKVISEEELKSNRISSKDQRMLPVFKNYQAGTPSCRLYIKNLAKTVAVDNLHYIYRRYYEEKEEEQGIMYDVRLMQEGRMKGQAFITLQGVEQAQKALFETNGFILQGKPMVVQFARSSKLKPEAKRESDA